VEESVISSEIQAGFALLLAAAAAALLGAARPLR
jgi:hypothetical protein